jgi:hypothetical protein
LQKHWAMTPNYSFILSILLFFTGLCVGSAQKELDLCDFNNSVFQSGEKLTYKLYYNWNFVWIPAGTLTFFILEEEKEYKIVVTGKTLESYNWFYIVDDVYTAKMDKKTFRPIWFKRDIKEGEYSIINEINFDYENGIVRSSLKHNDDETIFYEFEMIHCLHDLASLVYKLRNIDLEQVKKSKMINANLIFDEKTYEIPVKYLGEVKNKQIRNLGKLDLMKISPDLIAGNVFKDNTDMVIWVSDDQNKIPILIESPIKVGSIKAVLQAYENLKEPLFSE